jgi:hypothetical protein
MTGTLYPRGFLLTSSAALLEGGREHLPGWHEKAVADGWWLFLNPEPPGSRITDPRHKTTDLPDNLHSVGLDRGSSLVLMGHAVDPWNGGAEHEVLGSLRRILPPGRLPQARDRSLWNVLDSLTGRFVLAVLDRDFPWIVQDAVGLQPLYYASGPEGFAASSHSQLLGEVMGLERDPVVDELVASRFYGKGIQYLPGLRAPFLGMRMLTANTFLDVKGQRTVRFFPREPHGPVEDWDALVKECAGAMARSVEMLARNHRLAVSLSNGTGSRATLAACRSVTDRLVFFSHGSNAAEVQDGEGAGQLSAALGLTHEAYPVDVKGYRASPHPELEALLQRNGSGIRRPKVAEVAKLKTFLERFPPGRMKLKGHVSEIGRAFYCKSMGVQELPATLTPRHMSNLYKRNLFNRRLLRWTDGCFQEFRAVTGFGQAFFDYEEADLFCWEHRMPQWGALTNQDHDMVHDMTTLFDNRRLLVNLLKPDRPDRISDRLHRDVIGALWPEVLQVPLSSEAGVKARIRQLLERWFFRLND